MPSLTSIAPLDAVFKATLVLGLVALIARSLRDRSAATRHLVWTLGVAATLLIPVLRGLAPRWELPLVPVALLIAGPEAGEAAATSPPALVPPLRGGQGAIEPRYPPFTGGASLSRPAVPASALLGLAWLVGALAVAAPLIVGAARVWWFGRRSVTLASPAWSALVEEIAAGLGLRRPVRLLQGRARSMPLAWGIVRPVVLLPEDAASWPEAQRRAVLTHELAHVSRHDCLTQALAHAACALYWFHPLAWLAARRLRIERERACDDLVLRCGARGPDYADQLLQLARGARDAGQPAWAVAMARPSQLEGRLLAILDPALRRQGPSRRAALLTVAAAALVVALLAGLELGTRPALAARPVAPYEAPETGGETNDLQAVATSKEQGKQEPARTATQTETETRRPSPPPERVVAALSEALRDSDAEVRRQAVYSLGQLRAESSAAALTGALADSEADVRAQAAFALGELRFAAATPALAKALSDDAEAEVRQQAAFALGQIRATSAVEGLIAATKDVSEEVRQQAVFALGEIRDPRAVAALRAALGDGEAEVRQQAAFALGQLRVAEAVPALIAALGDASAEVRAQAAFALGEVGDPSASEALAAALKDGEAEVRRQAAFALGQLAK